MRVNSVNKFNVRGIFRNYAIFVVFICLVIILSVSNPYFLTVKNLTNVLRQVSINGLIGIGMTFVILTGGIDLSVGSVVAFTGIVGASMASAVSSPVFGGIIFPLWFTVLLSLLAGSFLGAVSGFFVAKFNVPAFIVTLGMLSIARGLTLIYCNGMPIPSLSTGFLNIGNSSFLMIPTPVWIFFIVFFAANFLLTQTKTGNHIYAVGSNEKCARISGVNVKKIKFIVYMISGFCSALAGLILTARTTAGLPQAGEGYELDAIAVVVIGGTSMNGGSGSLWGTLLGILIIGVINNGLNLMGVSSYYQSIIKGMIIVLAVLIDMRKNGNK